MIIKENEEKIKNKVIEILEQNGVDVIGDDEIFIDSLQFITSIVDLEGAFNIEIPDDELLIDNLKKVEDIVTIISKLL